MRTATDWYVEQVKPDPAEHRCVVVTCVTGESAAETGAARLGCTQVRVRELGSSMLFDIVTTTSAQRTVR
jgi:hypothetical protein